MREVIGGPGSSVDASPITSHASRVAFHPMSDQLQIRINGPPALPTLIYLPGVHGNWKLIGGFRCALNNRVRFVEISYPSTLTWSLDEHATAVVAALAEHGITRGWLLGESFSSQVVWIILARNKFLVEGLSPVASSGTPGAGQCAWRKGSSPISRFLSSRGSFALMPG